MPRCQTIVQDSQTKRPRKCRRSQRFGCICSCHARQYVVKIQAAWRSYRARSKITTFKQLPSDLWGEVLNYIAKANRQTYIKEHMYLVYRSHIMVYHRRCQAYKRRMAEDDFMPINEVLRMQDQWKVDMDRIKYFNNLAEGHTIPIIYRVYNRV
jgi:hypothetical protein